MPLRARNALINARCKTIRDAVRISDKELLEMQNFGKTSLRTWKQCLARLRADWPTRESSGR